MKVDRGETTTQVLLAVPVVFSLLLLAVQSAVYFHTANVASVAAAQGAAAGAAADGGMVPALDAAARMIAELSAQSSQVPSVTFTDSDIAVAVHLQVPQVAPFFSLTVTREFREPFERYIPENER
jgi:hypothetical protein